jgi:hypothetical protein
VLIILRVYLQIYVEHGRRLDRVARWMSARRAPTLAPDRNPLMRIFLGADVRPDWSPHTNKPLPQ